jgi:hypothetical protein
MEVKKKNQSELLQGLANFLVTNSNFMPPNTEMRHQRSSTIQPPGICDTPPLSSWLLEPPTPPALLCRDTIPPFSRSPASLQHAESITYVPAKRTRPLPLLYDEEMLYAATAIEDVPFMSLFQPLPLKTPYECSWRMSGIIYHGWTVSQL